MREALNRVLKDDENEVGEECSRLRALYKHLTNTEGLKNSVWA